MDIRQLPQVQRDKKQTYFWQCEKIKPFIMGNWMLRMWCQFHWQCPPKQQRNNTACRNVPCNGPALFWASPSVLCVVLSVCHHCWLKSWLQELLCVLMSNTVVCSLPSMLMSITAVRILSPYAPVKPPFVLESFYGLYNSLCRFFHFDLMVTFIFCALIVYIFNLYFSYRAVLSATRVLFR